MILDSFMKLSVESDACIMLSVNPIPKSPLIVPGRASVDFVLPTINLTVEIALFPSKIHPTVLPEQINETNSSKNACLHALHRIFLLSLH